MMSNLQPGPETTSDDIQERVLKVIAMTKRLPRESVSADSTFESLGIDSLDRLNILFDLESEFDIQINDEEAKQVETIPQMVAGVRQLVEAGKGESAGSPIAPPAVRASPAAAMPATASTGVPQPAIPRSVAPGPATPPDSEPATPPDAEPRDPASPAH